MKLLGRLHVSSKAMILLALFIICAGAITGFFTIYGTLSPTEGSFNNSNVAASPQTSLFPVAQQQNGTYLVQQAVTTEATMTASSTPSTQVLVPNSGSNNGLSSTATESTSSGSSSPVTNKSSSSGFVEFFSNVTLQVSSPSSTLKSVTTLAYSLGGYVAYSYAQNTSALAVLRVPAVNYQSALNQVESLGNVTYSSSTSNDVSVKYIDLNATLESLQTEQSSLVRLLNQSASINQTLILESQIQGVDAQINSIESQMLETRTLIDYSTITVMMDVATKPPPPPRPLSMKVTATPTSGEGPLSVTFNALVAGGVQPYIVNYNFGDGTSAQGQGLIHTFTSPSTYNVTITATDSSGNVSTKYVIVKVTSPPTHDQFGGFVNTIVALFISVIEGIAEVAVVVLPLAAVAALVIIPFRNRYGGKKQISRTGTQSTGNTHS